MKKKVIIMLVILVIAVIFFIATLLSGHFRFDDTGIVKIKIHTESTIVGSYYVESSNTSDIKKVMHFVKNIALYETSDVIGSSSADATIIIYYENGSEFRIDFYGDIIIEQDGRYTTGLLMGWQYIKLKLLCLSISGD